jgi:hypothetical protein
MSELGFEVTTGIGKTGVVGLMKGKAQGKTLLLRTLRGVSYSPGGQAIPY